MLKMNVESALSFFGKERVTDFIRTKKDVIADVLSDKKEDPEQVLGWFRVGRWTTPELMEKMEAKAREIREKADVFVLVGVGGSNNGARAVIKAMEALSDEKPKVKIVYAGNNLSSNAIHHLLNSLKGKSVYLDVIAKNFETLEPGLAFRILRRWMRGQFGDEMADRVIVTGTAGSQLNRIAEENGYLFLPFPDDIGGRYSVLSPVGLFPMAAAGIDIRSVARGGKDMEQVLKTEPQESNPAVVYAAIRHLCEEDGFAMEFLSSFEPALEYFSKWWVQLFAESEGKNHSGLYPVACSFSEDLHSVGQYIQSGKRNLAELFLRVERPEYHCVVQPDEKVHDGFAYLDNKDVSKINNTAFSATVKAHAQGGVPVNVLSIPRLEPYDFGQMFYFFELTCYLSGTFNGINPFDQSGVEAYKSIMLHELRKTV